MTGQLIRTLRVTTCRMMQSVSLLTLETLRLKLVAMKTYQILCWYQSAGIVGRTQSRFVD